MQPNVASIGRIVAGLGILGAGYYRKSWWGHAGVGPILTASSRFLLFGLSTGSVKPENIRQG